MLARFDLASAMARSSDNDFCCAGHSGADESAKKNAMRFAFKRNSN